MPSPIYALFAFCFYVFIFFVWELDHPVDRMFGVVAACIWPEFVLLFLFSFVVERDKWNA